MSAALHSQATLASDAGLALNSAVASAIGLAKRSVEETGVQDVHAACQGLLAAEGALTDTQKALAALASHVELLRSGHDSITSSCSKLGTLTRTLGSTEAVLGSACSEVPKQQEEER